MEGGLDERKDEATQGENKKMIAVHAELTKFSDTGSWGTSCLEDVKKLKNKRGVNSASKTIAPGCPGSDYWRGGIHFTPN
jgi:TnpA family transposase